jgi:hypothetical protein
LGGCQSGGIRRCANSSYRPDRLGHGTPRGHVPLLHLNPHRRPAATRDRRSRPLSPRPIREHAITTPCRPPPCTSARTRQSSTPTSSTGTENWCGLGQPSRCRPQMCIRSLMRCAPTRTGPPPSATRSARPGCCGHHQPRARPHSRSRTPGEHHPVIRHLHRDPAPPRRLDDHRFHMSNSLGAAPLLLSAARSRPLAGRLHPSARGSPPGSALPSPLAPAARRSLPATISAVPSSRPSVAYVLPRLRDDLVELFFPAH